MYRSEFGDRVWGEKVAVSPDRLGRPETNDKDSGNSWGGEALLIKNRSTIMEQ
jgi:hypothetical protein